MSVDNDSGEDKRPPRVEHIITGDITEDTDEANGASTVRPILNELRSPQSVRSSHLNSLIDASRKSFAGLHVDTVALQQLADLEDVNEDEEKDEEADAGLGMTSDSHTSPGLSMREQRSRQSMRNIRDRFSVVTQRPNERFVEVKMKDFSYFIPVKMDAPTVPTVFNQSVCYGAYEVFRRIHRYLQVRKEKAGDQGVAGARRMSFWRPTTAQDIVLPFAKRAILKDVNLVLKPGNAYLILGPPGCGKTSLLKAISDKLPYKADSADGAGPDQPHREGRIEFNGVSTQDTPLIVPNLCSFVGQLDNHAPYLTVRETFEFAFQCRTGGKHENVGLKMGSVAGTTSPGGTLDEQRFTENLTIEGLDLAVCADTFVGDTNVRGVSGGQRRRVTVGEMMQGQSPVACADEISTGLDAQVTYDIIHSIVAFAKAARTTRIVSLLQPGPETFSLFDEVILMAQGMVIFAGPISEVVDYFESLGYKQPPTMDVADFLQSIPTPDGSLYTDHEHYSTDEFVARFRESDQYARIISQLNGESPYDWTDKAAKTDDHNEDKLQDGRGKKFNVPKEYQIPYQNSFRRSMMLNLKRHLTLWKRDYGFIIGKAFENIGMAVATGGILFGQAKLPSYTDVPTNEAEAEGIFRVVDAVYAALFMTSLHILLGTMTSAPDEIDARSIHYKHYDAKFYQVYAYVTGRLLSTIPQRSIEIFSFGIPLYWMVGLDPNAGSFFIYLLILIAYTTGLKMMFSILAQVLPKKANVQGVGTFFVLICTLFGGFIVYPGTVPNFYIWLYWCNPMTWALQGLAVNEFSSSKYDVLGFGKEYLLSARGFQTGREWIGYSFVYLIPYTLLSTFILGYVMRKVRIEPERSRIKKKTNVAIGSIIVNEDSTKGMNLPFTPVDLTFDKLIYEVKASTGDEKLRLLNEVSGAFMAGRMCALMGSSGAGTKTTLLDVIAMRKTSGFMTGEIRLNGFLQERTSFLRCSGYVEQFDVQQPELTIRETVEFCARLRLDAKDPMIENDAGKVRFAAQVLETMELTDIQNLQVGSYAEGGLSFEQRKRLAIACELAGSPSVLFLDEPTSGLDSRGAIVVMRAMKRIADSGRTVCATIHQPSSAVFEMFDDLLLLKKGGNVVFFGELGQDSVELIKYFESRGATPIEYGENPGAWMLRAFSGDHVDGDTDWPALYKSSEQYQEAMKKITAIKESADESKRIHFDGIYVTSFKERLWLMIERMFTIYKRSPAYNLARLMIALLYSFIIGSIFLRGGGRRSIWTENEMAAVVSTMFFSLIVIGITSISMAVPVTKQIRDVFYKHRASGMLKHTSLSWALFLSEIPYICFISIIFAIIYYATVGLFYTGKQFGLYWVFFTLNVAIYSYFGQAFICLVKDVPTAGALVGALIGYNIFFSGLVVRPQYFTGAFQLGYYTAPGRFALEGLIITQFQNNTTPVTASYLSPYYFSLNCTVDMTDPADCQGTISDFVDFFFGGRFTVDNLGLDLGCLFGYLVLSKIVTELALWKFNYVNT